MFGLDPLNQSVAIAEIVLLLVLAAFIGWLLGRIARQGRVSALRGSIADKTEELEKCREAKSAGRPVTIELQTASVQAVATPPAFVHADPLLPVFSNDVTPEFIDAAVPAPTSNPTADVSATDVPTVSATVSPGMGFVDNLEAAVLSRIAARATEVNFDRIGRASASEADDLKDIVGIGPFLERKLHSLGIYTFKQVASFTKEDVDKDQ